MTKFAVFRMGDEVFGIEIDRVVEILKSQKTYTLPELPEFLSGVITVRGEVVPLLDHIPVPLEPVHNSTHRGDVSEGTVADIGQADGTVLHNNPQGSCLRSRNVMLLLEFCGEVVNRADDFSE